MDTGFERIVPVLLAVAAAGLGWGAVRLKRRLGQSERERRRATDELNRRLSELLSVRELFHVLSGSLRKSVSPPRSLWNSLGFAV